MTEEQKMMSLDDLEGHYEEMGLKNVTPSYWKANQYENESETGDWMVSDEREDVPVPGRVRFVKLYDSCWDQSGDGYASEVMEDATWDDIMRLADAMIVATGDYHHVFLEGVKVGGVQEDGAKLAHLIMGS